MVRVKYSVMWRNNTKNSTKQKIKAIGNMEWIVDLEIFELDNYVEAHIEITTKYHSYNLKFLIVKASSIKAIMCFVKQYIEYLDSTGNVMIVAYNDKKYKQIISDGWHQELMCKVYQQIPREAAIKEYLMEIEKNGPSTLNMSYNAYMILYKYVVIANTSCGMLCLFSIFRNTLAKKAMKHAIEFCSNIEGKINII